MASSSATAPSDGSPPGTSDGVDSFFFRFKFQAEMIRQLISKLIQETIDGGYSPEIRALPTKLLNNDYSSLFQQIQYYGNPIKSDFVYLSPQEMLIALKGCEKGKLDDLILRFQGIQKRLGEIEDQIRSFLWKSRGVSKNYAWILYIEMGLGIHKQNLELELRDVGKLKEREVMERLKAEFEARKKELEEFGGSLEVFKKEFSRREMGVLGKGMEYFSEELLKSSISGARKEVFYDLKKMFGEFQNAWFPSGKNQQALDSTWKEDEFAQIMGKFDKELNEIGDKIFMRGHDSYEALEKQNAKELEEKKKKNAAIVIVSSSDSSSSDENLRELITVKEGYSSTAEENQNPTDGNFSGAKENDSSTGESSKKRKT